VTSTVAQAGLRDASWYRYPSGHGWATRPPRYHVVVVNQDGGEGPACNPHGVLLVEDTYVDADSVEPGALLSGGVPRAVYRSFARPPGAHDQGRPACRTR
jgi:hypothetical protein